MLSAMQNPAPGGASHAPATFALYGERPGETELDLIHIEDIKSRARLYDWTITPHAHAEMWQLIYIGKGGAVATIENERVRMGDRSILCIPNGVVHGFEFKTDTVGWVLSVETRLLETTAYAQTRRFLMRNRFRVTKLSLTALQNREISVLFNNLYKEFTAMREGRSVMLDSLANALLILLLRDAPRENEDGDGAPRGSRLFSAYRDLINQHFRDHWTVPAYADALSVSQSQLARACRRLTGRSPAALINARLILEAQRNLHYTEASAAQIAIDLGFQDPAYFSRFFKRITGLTPLAYRSSSRRNQR